MGSPPPTPTFSHPSWGKGFFPFRNLGGTVGLCSVAPPACFLCSAPVRWAEPLRRGGVRGASSRAFPPSAGPARGRGRKAEPGAQPPSSCAPGPSVWGEPHPQHIGRGRGRESGQWGSPGAGDLRVSQ